MKITVLLVALLSAAPVSAQIPPALVFRTVPLGNGGANDVGRKYSFSGTYAVRFETKTAQLVAPSFAQAPPASAPDMAGLPIAGAKDWPGYLGSPRLASAAHGAKVVQAVSEKAVAAVLRILGGADPKTMERFATALEKSPPDVVLDAASLEAETARAKRQQARIDGRAQEGHLPGADGVRLFHRKVGAGPQAVVFLHGGPGSNFRGPGDHLERLASSERTVVLYDQRGSGLSETVSDPRLLTAEHHVRDLEALRQHFGFERMSLVGLSWGAGLAALYADAHPDRVERLLLVSPMPPTADRFRERLEKLGGLQTAAETARRKELQSRMAQASDSEAQTLCRELTGISFRLYLVDPTPAKLDHAALRCAIPAAAIRNRSVVEAATFSSLGAWNFLPRLARVRVPSLVVEGARTNVPLAGVQDWVAALPNARLVLVPEAGHEAFLDQPDAFHELADGFLRGKVGPR